MGQLAELTGVTARTLRYYDQIGLLNPTGRSEAGHRLYTREDLLVLQRTMSPKQLGFSLTEIRTLLRDPHFHPMEALRLQLQRVGDQIATLEEMRRLLAQC